jgi:2-alkyl-3-oxoalkanoate reductase
LKPSPGIYQSVIAFHEALRDGRRAPVDAADATRAVRWVVDGSRAADEDKDRRERTRAAYRPKPARILVTGASGFVGSALVRRLCEAGERPRLLLRRAVPASLQGFGLDVVQGDLGEPDAVARAVEGVDLVYHAGAGMRGGAREFEAGTVWGTRNVVDACVRYGVKRLVHVSSLGVLDVAGHAENVAVDEHSAAEPFPERRGNYTKTKLEAERMVLAAIREQNLPAVIVRPGQIFGPGAERVAPSGVISFGSLWMVAGRGRRLLPLVFVEDVVSGLIAAAEAPDAVGRIVHLVDPTPITQNEYLKHAATALNGIRILRTPEALLRGLALVCDGMSSILKRSLPLSSYRVASLRPLHPVDQTIAREVLGWQPEVGVRRGLEVTFGREHTPYAAELVPAAEHPARAVNEPVEVERG